MLFVLFQLGKNRYALEASRVVEVVPLLALKPFPQAPPGVAGLFVYRGQPVPAVDLCALALGRPAVEHLSTRILIVQQNKTGGESRLIGLIVERATGTLRRDEKDFANAGGPPNASRPLPPMSPTSTAIGCRREGEGGGEGEPLLAPFLGPVLLDDQGVIQFLNPQELLDAGGSPLRLAHSLEAGHAPN